MGAEVIRIDRIKNHDFVRFHGGTEAMKDAGLGASYISQNAGKSCIQLDLKETVLTYVVQMALADIRPDAVGVGASRAADRRLA